MSLDGVFSQLCLKMLTPRDAISEVTVDWTQEKHLTKELIKFLFLKFYMESQKV